MNFKTTYLCLLYLNWLEASWNLYVKMFNFPMPQNEALTNCCEFAPVEAVPEVQRSTENTDMESFHHLCEPFPFQALACITRGTLFTCGCSRGAGSFTLDALYFPLWLSEALGSMKNSKIYLFIVDSLAYSGSGDSYHRMPECGRLPSRWLSVFRVPMFLSSISASLSASSSLFWFKPWPGVVWFILVPQEVRRIKR